MNENCSYSGYESQRSKQITLDINQNILSTCSIQELLAQCFDFTYWRLFICPESVIMRSFSFLLSAKFVSKVLLDPRNYGNGY